MTGLGMLFLGTADYNHCATTGGVSTFEQGDVTFELLIEDAATAAAAATTTRGDVARGLVGTT